MKKISSSSCLALLFFSFSVSAQSPYQLHWGRDLGMLGGSAALWGGAHLLGTTNRPLTVAEINRLDEGELYPFQRWSVHKDSELAGRWSDYFLSYSQVLPLAFMVKNQHRKDWKTLLVLYGETSLLTRGLTTMTKNVVRRRRPYLYNDDVPIQEKLNTKGKQSFFSGHTSKTAAMCFFTAKVYADYYPDSQWRPFIWSAAVTLPAVTGYLRMANGQHFLLDVAAAYLVGASVGYLVPHFHQVNRKKGETELGLRVYGAANGVLVQYWF